MDLLCILGRSLVLLEKHQHYIYKKVPERENLFGMESVVPTRLPIWVSGREVVCFCVQGKALIQGNRDQHGEGDHWHDGVDPHDSWWL